MNPIRGDLAIVRSCVMMLLCLLFPSCTKQSINTQTSVEEQPDTQRNNALLDAIIQQEAMLVDVPIPLYDERIIPSLYNETESDTLVFAYKSPLTHSQAVEFFINQMERYGWRHLVSFDTNTESILQFKSPDRYCTVVINPTSLHPSLKASEDTVKLRRTGEDESHGSSIFIYIKKERARMLAPQ